jgi:hypothetical protein
MIDFTDNYHQIMTRALYHMLIEADPNRTKFEPFTAEECKLAAIERVAKIRTHNKRYFSEVEEFAIYFYTEADYEKIAVKCNAMLEDAWAWG